MSAWAADVAGEHARINFVTAIRRLHARQIQERVLIITYVREDDSIEDRYCVDGSLKRSSAGCRERGRERKQGVSAT